MSVLEGQVEVAIARDDLEATVRTERMRNKVPAEVTSRSDQQARLNFLRRSLEDDELAERTFERVLAGNELQPVAYLERGAIASRAIARVQVRSPTGTVLEWATGFLISPRVLVTNHHVLPNASRAAPSLAHFSYEADLDDSPLGPIVFSLHPEELFHTSPELDFTVVAVGARSDDDAIALDSFGCLPLLETVGKAFEGEWLTIVQHPGGERKQLCVRENRLIKRTPDMLWYTTDTMPGSSGSPVFNNDWYVVALHHRGIPEERNGVWQTVDGRDYDPRTMDDTHVKWIANEGVRASRITQTLRKELPTHPLLQPLFAATPSSARIARRLTPYSASNPPSEPTAMTLNQTIATAAAASRIIEATTGLDERAPTTQPAKFELPFDADYSTRKGFEQELLGSGARRVRLPVLSPALEQVAAPLIAPTGKNKYVLHYHNYSVVMHKERRLALYSAASIRFDQRFDMNRPADVWRRDPRILEKYQIQNFYYANNQFDRGHLTRREDLEFGPKASVALESAADTCHWTNCTPQHARFNQNKQIWQGIERHILESTILADRLSAQIITGPVLDEGDPEYKNIQYPLQYWKVVAALDENDKLLATAYIASQQEVIDQHGIESVEAFGPFKTFQVRISEIERLTGLTFESGPEDASVPLRAVDPLARQPQSRRRTRRGPSESALARTGTEYYEITDLDDIVL